MNHRTYQLLRKGWTVIGYTFNGSAYCPDHMPTVTYAQGPRDIPQPIFASDDLPHGWGCDECGKVID